MQTKIIHLKGQIKLIVNDKLKSPKDSDVLAVLSNYAGTPCWELEDIRLTKHCKIGRHWAAGADRSIYLPKDAIEAAYVKSMLREFQELPDGALIWSTFDGMVRGAPEINGCKPACDSGFDRAGYFNQSGYFDKKEGLASLVDIKLYWDALDTPLIGWRAINPNQQPSASAIQFSCYLSDISASEQGQAPKKLVDKLLTEMLGVAERQLKIK